MTKALAYPAVSAHSESLSPIYGLWSPLPLKLLQINLIQQSQINLFPANISLYFQTILNISFSVKLLKYRIKLIKQNTFRSFVIQTMQKLVYFYGPIMKRLLLWISPQLFLVVSTCVMGDGTHMNTGRPNLLVLQLHSKKINFFAKCISFKIFI